MAEIETLRLSIIKFMIFSRVNKVGASIMSHFTQKLCHCLIRLFQTIHYIQGKV